VAIGTICLQVVIGHGKGQVAVTLLDHETLRKVCVRARRFAQGNDPLAVGYYIASGLPTLGHVLA
jgi:hypothetical protein